MLRYKTETRPGLFALYDIRPGNGAGLFLQPWSLHGAPILMIILHPYSTSQSISCCPWCHISVFFGHPHVKLFQLLLLCNAWSNQQRFYILHVQTVFIYPW